MLTWYALKSRPNAERKAEASLRERGFDVYLPVETLWRRPRGAIKREAFDKPLIAGYLFVGLNPGKSLYFAIQADGVQSVVGWGGEARAIRPAFVNDLRARQAAGEFDHTPAKRFTLRKGDKARILTGPFKGQIGEFLEADDAGRVRLFLDGIFRGGIAVDSDAIEAADQRPKAA